MKHYSIKIETENLVKKTKQHLTDITPHVAKDIFITIKENFYDEYLNLCRETKNVTVNQWIGKAIMSVFNLKHKNEHAIIKEDGHLIRNYTIFYQ
jgi:hypothetical protein